MLSIVIPVYNVEEYIGKCLDSILAQTYTDYEVIVVNDGSTDNTREIIDEYANRDSRITAIHKKNEGVSIARNTGIDVATGEYFLFFDGDDFVEPYCLEELVETVKEQDVDTVIYGYHRFENGKIKETCYPRFDKDIYEGQEIIEQLLPAFIGFSCDKINAWLRNEKDALYVENPALWRSMVSAAVIKENNIRFNKNLKVGEDTVFISEYLSYAKRCYIKQKCYYYLVTRETSTIYVYEKKPMAKLEGKLKLLDARKELTDRIMNRRNDNIHDTWQGTVVMSSIEIAFLMAAKNDKYGYFRRYGMFLKYIKRPEVRKSIKDFKLEIRPSVKIVPFLLVKWRLYFVLFLCVTLLEMVHYEFKRG